MPPKNTRKSSQKLVFSHPGAPRSTPAAPRSFTVLPGGPTVSTRFNTVHPGRAPLLGPPRFTTVVFDMSKTTGKTPGSSRSIRHHPGPSRWHTVQPPVLPGSPRSMDRGEPGVPGAQWDWGIRHCMDGVVLRSRSLDTEDAR